MPVSPDKENVASSLQSPIAIGSFTPGVV